MFYVAENMKTEVIFGIHPVYEALRAGRRIFSEIRIAKFSKRLEKIVSYAESHNITVKKTQPPQLRAVTGTDFHQGIGAIVSDYPCADISDMLDSGGDVFLLLLDNIVDPHNLGALIRTALCVGIGGVVIPKDRSAQPTPDVSKASAGALEHMLLARVTNMTRTITELRKKGVWIGGLDREGRQSLFDARMDGPLALIIGGEEKGIRPLVKKHCDFLLSIPQQGPLNSLNASVAGAVVMYEAFRQRSEK